MLPKAGVTVKFQAYSQPNKPTRSHHGQKFLAKDVFLSHSGKQKDFVRQLHRDLTKAGVSCFFDEDRDSLPLAEDFPPRIFEATETCKVAVLLLSKEFLESRWPMLELSAFVKARDIIRTNPTLKILPLFFMIPPAALKNITPDDEKWKECEKSDETRAEWHRALNAMRRINGLTFVKGDDEGEFRDKIVQEIWLTLPTPSQRYQGPRIQGEKRMCQAVADFFNSVHPNEKGIHIAGLYGIAGQGKTTLGKAFCNFQLRDFQGKVCHLEFSGGDSLQRIKLALDYLTGYPQSQLQELTTQDQAQGELSERVKGQRVLLVLDNITDENIEEVRYYLGKDLGKNSWILLSARSVNVLVKHFKIESQSCMCVPSVEEDEAIRILLERTSLADSTLVAEDTSFASKCANRCSFKEIGYDIGTFHPLALKAFGGYLNSKYGPTLSKWVAEIDGLDDVFAVLGKAFDEMDPKCRTIFMLLAVYMLPNMSNHKVTEWLAIICNEEIEYIEKAVKDLWKKAFIENFEPEIRIHDLLIEFAQSKAKRMERWLWWKGDESSTRGLISQEQAGFELVKLEQSKYRSPLQIAAKYLQNLLVLQLVDVENISTLDFSRMDSIRSITLHNCKDLAAFVGMENLPYLAWLQIRGVNPVLKLPDLSSLRALQYLDIHIPVSHELGQMGDLTPCVFLREIKVFYPSLLEFPRVNGLPFLEKVQFSLCDKVKGPLDCTNCVMLQTIVLKSCSQMAASPVLVGCKKLSQIVLLECDKVTTCPDVDVPSALKTLELSISSKAASAPRSLESCYGLENLQLWNMGELKELPSFRCLSNLTVLKLGKCGIREPPDLTCCVLLEDVHFFTLKNLERFPNFSSLRELKKLSLCNCITVQDPPDIEECHQLQVFHLLYNDNMKGLSKMDRCAQLEEIKVSWHCEDQVTYEGIDPDSCEVDDNLDSCLDYWNDVILENLNDVFVPVELKEWQRTQGKTMLAKKYFRGVKLYYSVTAPYESNKSSKRYSQDSVTLRLVDSRLLVFPTLESVSKDCNWLNKVRGYFAGKKNIARACAACENVEVSSHLLPPSPRYRVPPMQGEARMCQEVADFINTIPPNEKGIRIAGLYGMSGLGKTSLAKAFCNFKLGDFDGKVCHLEYPRGNKLDRRKLAVKYLSDCPESQLELVTSEGEGDYFFKTLVEGQRVLLVVDNFLEHRMDEMTYYLEAELGKDSCILLIARSIDALQRRNLWNFNINPQSCMRVPSLTEEEAVTILLERTSLEESAKRRGFAFKCAKICSFEEDKDFAPTFHPLALKTFGRHVFRKHCSYWSCDAEIDGFADTAGDGLNDMSVVLGKAIEDMDPNYHNIFKLLVLSRTTDQSSKVVEWLARELNEEIEYIKEVLEDLCKNAFIEEIEPQIRIHDFIHDFVFTKYIMKKMGPKAHHKEKILAKQASKGRKISVDFQRYPNRRKHRLRVLFPEGRFWEGIIPNGRFWGKLAAFSTKRRCSTKKIQYRLLSHT